MSYSKQKAEHLISGIHSQPYDSEQYLLLHGQGKGVSRTYLSEPIGSCVALVLGSHKQWADILDELLKLNWTQPCQGVQHIGMELYL